MSKILSGVAGMLRFRACRVANHTNQNIQHTLGGNTNSYTMRTGHVMFVESDNY